MEEKYCGGCKTTKSRTEWHRRARSPDGLATQCKACNKAFIIEWRKRPEVRAKEQLRGRSVEKKSYRARHEEQAAPRALSLLNQAKQRAIKRKRMFNIDASDIQPQLELGVCAVTGIPFDMARGAGHKPFGPSIDRKDPTKGYVKGNVQVICWALNAARGYWGDDVLKTLAQALVKTYGDPSHEDN